MKTTLIKLLFESSDVPKWVCKEVLRWNEKYGRVLDKKVISYLQKFKPKNSIVLYRGLGFNRSDAVYFLKKLSIKECKIGERGVYKTGRFQSWTSEVSISEDFAGIPSHTKEGRSEESLGIIIKTTVDPDQIALSLATLPEYIKTKCLLYKQNEFVLYPGVYSIEIQKLFGPWEESVYVDLREIMKKIGSDIALETKGVYKKEGLFDSGFYLMFPDFVDSKTLEKVWGIKKDLVPIIKVVQKNEGTIIIEGTVIPEYLRRKLATSGVDSKPHKAWKQIFGESGLLKINFESFNESVDFVQNKLKEKLLSIINQFKTLIGNL